MIRNAFFGERLKDVFALCNKLALCTETMHKFHVHTNFRNTTPVIISVTGQNLCPVICIYITP